jgi:DNA-binding transcriptional regulator YdaS (Cro superfamily)
MFKDTAIAYYGTQEKLAAVLGIKQAAIPQWGEIIPEKQAMKLSLITKGTLKYNSALCSKAA